MFSVVPTSAKAIADYRPVVGDGPIDELRELAAPLREARVLHLNATAFGGGVAEILGTLVPLMRDLGLQAEWQVISGADEFFAATKAIHNGLQGMFIPWTPQMREVWLRYNEMNASLCDADYDFVIVHDPQPAGILRLLPKGKPRQGRWIWRCHIDLTEAQLDIWDFLRPFVMAYDGLIFTLEDYVKEGLRHPRIWTVPPAIDPLSPKNVPLSRQAMGAILARYGVAVERPLMVQVSRFDPWKDPLGVIDIYRLMKRELPHLQLVLVASMAHDDPEGWAYYERTARRAGEDYDIHLLTNLNGVGNVEVNAFQGGAGVVVQKSVREGFGLSVSEALWKGRPVVAGNAGGIPLQIIPGETGYLAHTTAEFAEGALHLLRHPEEAESMGLRGREHVRQHFLITRYLRDYLRIFQELSPYGRKAP